MKDQEFLFKLFTDWYDEAVSGALREGSFDDGVYDLQGDLVLGPQVVYIDPFNKEQRTKRYVIAVDRGIKWEDAVLAYEEAQALFAKANTRYYLLFIIYYSLLSANLKVKYSGKQKDYNGFYQHNKSKNIILATKKMNSVSSFHVRKPNLGKPTSYSSA